MAQDDKVTLRFHGRFLHVQHTTDTLDPVMVSVVAPRFPVHRFGAHRPLMSINHGAVLFQGGNPKSVITTFEPSFRMLTDGGADPQWLVWDLTGLTVRYPPSAGSRISIAPNLPNLAEFEDNENRSAALKGEALDPGKEILANAVVEVLSAGRAAGGRNIPYKLSRERAAAACVPAPVLQKGTETELDTSPPEMIEYDIPLGARSEALEMDFIAGGGRCVGKVHVKRGGTVCFSNNCPKIHDTPLIDLEFSRYYDLLVHHDRDALIPFNPNIAKTIEGVPCYVQGGMPVIGIPRPGDPPLKAIRHHVPKSKPTSKPGAHRGGRVRSKRARG